MGRRNFVTFDTRSEGGEGPAATVGVPAHSVRKKQKLGICTPKLKQLNWQADRKVRITYFVLGFRS
jgi:hypothetical protein